MRRMLEAALDGLCRGISAAVAAAVLICGSWAVSLAVDDERDEGLLADYAATVIEAAENAAADWIESALAGNAK